MIVNVLAVCSNASSIVVAVPCNKILKPNKNVLAKLRYSTILITCNNKTVMKLRTGLPVFIMRNLKKSFET